MPHRNKRKDDEAISLARVLDESFECMHRMALSICHTLARPKDRMICRSTLDELVQLSKSRSVDVKQNVRIFLRFYLQVLRWSQQNQPLQVYERWYGDACQSQCDQPPTNGEQEEMHIWLDDGRSYLAMKHFDDGSAMIYSAVAKNTSAGWAENGFKALKEEYDKAYK